MSDVKRQGDVVIVRLTGAVPETDGDIPREGGRVILAHGEVTGHAHAITEKKVKLRAIKGIPEWMLLVAKEPCVIRHEEHAPIALDPGVYKVRRFQREYDPEADRRVED